MSSGWHPLPTGAFSGIDWSRPGATRGFDPYLVWGEATGFSSQGGAVPRWLPIAVELNPQTDIQRFIAAGHPAWLRVPAAYGSFGEAALRFCTARVRPEFFTAIQPGGPLHALVRRFELGLPLHAESSTPEGEWECERQAHDDVPASSRSLPATQLRSAEEPLTGKVLAFVDDSMALAHANLQHAGRPRVVRFWRQDDHGKGRRPADLGYGRELTGADIHAAMQACRTGELVDEDAVYAALGLSTLGEQWPHGRVPFHALDLATSHGTHVADLAAGPRTVQARTANLPPDMDAPPSWDPAAGDASRCPLVAVQLDPRTVADTSGRSMNVAILDALMYILSRCGPQAQVVVNLSFGKLAGPHDGTGLLEAAMDHLIGLCRGRLQIAIAAGNSYQLRTHANLLLQPRAERTLYWRVHPDDRTPSFLELWIQHGCAGVDIELTPPGGSPLPALPMGAGGLWTDTDAAAAAVLVYPEQVALGTRGSCALLALAPTFSFQPGTAARSGVWRVRLRNQGEQAAVVDAYIERDDVVPGTRSGARQSHLEDDPSLAADEQYELSAWVDDPLRSTPLRRSGSFNSIATGQHTVSVGATTLGQPTAWARYSPRSPDPDEGRVQRPGVVKLPKQARPGDESLAVAGLSAAGSRSGGMVRMSGTSGAAPQAARDMINAAAAP